MRSFFFFFFLTPWLKSVKTHRLWTEFGAEELLQKGDEELVECVADSLEMAAGEDDDLLWVGGQPEGDALHGLLEKRGNSSEKRLKEGH